MVNKKYCYDATMVQQCVAHRVGNKLDRCQRQANTAAKALTTARAALTELKTQPDLNNNGEAERGKC